MGGFFSPEMAWAGFHHLVIKGKAKHPVYIYIHNGEIEIRDAGDLWGLSVTEAQWAIRDRLGDQEVKSMVCGPAGENLVRYANVMTGIKNAGGRTGMGCVMGSKNLKAVAARGTMDIQDRAPQGSPGIQQAIHRPDRERQGEPDPGNPRHPLHLGRYQFLGRNPVQELPVQPVRVCGRYRTGAPRRNRNGDHGPLPHDRLFRLPGALPGPVQDP
jgi:hypothetical protein